MPVERGLCLGADVCFAALLAAAAVAMAQLPNESGYVSSQQFFVYKFDRRQVLQLLLLLRPT